MRKNVQLFVSALLDIRNEWTWYLLLMTVSPLSILLFLRLVVGDGIDFEAYVVGSVMMTFGTGIFLGLGQNFAYYKATSALDYYLALPLSKGMIIASLVFRNIVLSIPSTAVLILVGLSLYQVELFIGFPFLVTLVLTSFSLAGMGTMIGVCSRNMQVASILTQVLAPVFTYLAPVFLPQSEMPGILGAISYIFPTTYAANALRGALLHDQFTVDTPVLIVIAVVSMAAVSKFVDWSKG
ncbi:MAG: ABC transporter permease [Clostridium sp.]|jgi:ABC-2 type transport system permease protein|nr:ABC transporter permease [Clostridium sp.]